MFQLSKLISEYKAKTFQMGSRARKDVFSQMVPTMLKPL